MSSETKTALKPERMKQLQELIQVNIDSRDGFRHAAGELEDMTLTSLFRSLADQREQQADELSRYVSANRGQPDRTGTYSAALHRIWMSLRTSLSFNDLYAVLAEAERGEDQIKSAYEEALRDCAGSAMSDVLTQHYVQVKAAHDRIRDLRDEMRDSP